MKPLYVILRRIIAHHVADAVCEEAQNRTDPEEYRKTAKEILTELHPLWRLLRWRQRIRTVTLQYSMCLCGGQTLARVRNSSTTQRESHKRYIDYLFFVSYAEPLKKFVQRYCMLILKVAVDAIDLGLQFTFATAKL